MNKTCFIVILTNSSSYLLYGWWNRKQELARLKSQLAQKEQEAQQNYQEQKNYLELTTNLAKSPQIQAFFSDLLRNYAERFARSKQIDISHYSLNFGGFYQGEQPDQQPLKNQYQKLGNCCFIPEKKQTVISLNQFYLLNKLGYDRYFATPSHYLEINFNNLLKTCSHELAHYIQFVKYGKSSCESDWGTDKYVAELAKEHEEFTGEIYQLIKSSGEYLEWERRWQEIKDR